MLNQQQMKVKEIFEKMEYGPAPESKDLAMQWLKERKQKFGLFIGGKWQAPSSKKYFLSENPADKSKLAEIAKAEDPVTRKEELVDEYRERFANPYVAAERGYVDDIIEPRETRPRLINALNMLQNKRDQNPPKKHGNIPL